MGGNGNSAGYTHHLPPKEVWDIFDRLPEDLRDAINYAPYQISPVAIRDRLLATNSEDATLDWIERRILELIPSKAFKAYGREHPSAEGYAG